jgi:cytochrome c oxidase subunit IV
MAETPHDDQHHPSVGQYVEIGVILAALTALEVALFFADIPVNVTVPSLIALTVMKFVLVVMWFMHLRFDHRLLNRIFLMGFVLALVLYAVVLVILVL